MEPATSPRITPSATGTYHFPSFIFSPSSTFSGPVSSLIDLSLIPSGFQPRNKRIPAKPITRPTANSTSHRSVGFTENPPSSLERIPRSTPSTAIQHPFSRSSPTSTSLVRDWESIPIKPSFYWHKCEYFHLWV